MSNTIEIDRLSLKVELLERALATFQKDVELKMNIFEQVLSSKTDQFSIQKSLIAKEELLYNGLLSKWKSTVQKSPETLVSIPACVESYSTRKSQLVDANNRMPINCHSLSEGSKENCSIAVLQPCKTEIISSDPLETVSTIEETRPFTIDDGRNTHGITITMTSPPRQPGDSSVSAHSPFYGSVDRNSDLLNENENGGDDADAYDNEEEEVQVIDMKFSVTANEVERPEIITLKAPISMETSQMSPGTSIQPNIDLLLNSGTTITSNGPTSTNLYSALRNKYIQKRSNAFPTFQYPPHHYQHHIHNRSFHKNPQISSSTAHSQTLHQGLPLLHRSSTLSFSNPTNCSDCGNQFGRPSMLKKHREEQICARPFECAVCDQSMMSQYFNDKIGITMHMLVVHKLRKFRVCQFCRKCFGPFRGLLEHQLEQHPELAQKQVKQFKHRCLICPKSYSTRNDLVCHSRLHTGERPFSCPGCKRTFTDNRNLAKHLHTCPQKNTSSDNNLTSNYSTIDLT